jgi:triacylglycerol lipase
MPAEKGTNVIRETDEPTERHQSTLPPNLDYRYFENGDTLHNRFRRRCREYHKANAWWLAEASYLAYAPPGFSRMAWELAGFPGFRFFQGRVADCSVAWNRRVCIVAFRGTELRSSSTLHELLTDANAVPTDFAPGGRVHRGFREALDEIWDGEDGLAAMLDEIRSANKRCNMWITGHSLGGALAALAFARYEQAAGLYAFGAPRIGDGAFAELFQRRPAFRIEYAGDPIPLVPPDLPKLGFDFKDIGELKYFNREGKLLDERPSFDGAEHRRRLSEYFVEKREVGRRLGRAARRQRRSLKGLKSLLGEAGEEIRTIGADIAEYLQELQDSYGIDLSEHMPFNYCAVLWNDLAGKSPRKSS